MKYRSDTVPLILALICGVCFVFSAPLFIIPFISEQFGPPEILVLVGSGIAYFLGIMFFHFANDYGNVRVSIILGLTFPIFIVGSFFLASLVFDFLFYIDLFDAPPLAETIPVIIMTAICIRLLGSWLARKYP